MKRSIIGATALLVLTAALLPAQAMAGKASAVLAINYDSDDGVGNIDFGGTVESSDSRCESPRKITLYREEGDKDEKMGKTKSIPNIFQPGEPAGWQVDDTDATAGTYYASAKKTKKCKKAVSEDYVYPSGRAKQNGGAKTKVKLGLSYFPEVKTRNYDAFLKSKDEGCLDNRTVTFFEELDGADEKIGSDTTNEFGSAGVSDSPAPPFAEGERFYAKVKKSNGCKKGKSKVSEIGPQP